MALGRAVGEGRAVVKLFCALLTDKLKKPPSLFLLAGLYPNGRADSYLAPFFMIEKKAALLDKVFL